MRGQDVLKTCSCCSAPVTRAEWLDLPLVGTQECEGEPYELELRTHGCGTTIALEVPRGCGAGWRRQIVELTGRLSCSQRWHEAALPYLRALRGSWVTRDGEPMGYGDVRSLTRGECAAERRWRSGGSRWRCPVAKPLHCPGRYGWLSVVEDERERRAEALEAFNRDERASEDRGASLVIALVCIGIAVGALVWMTVTQF